MGWVQHNVAGLRALVAWWVGYGSTGFFGNLGKRWSCERVSRNGWPERPLKPLTRRWNHWRAPEQRHHPLPAAWSARCV